MNLLINEPPLQVLPSLAAAIGLNKSIVLQQMHYWLIRSEHIYEEKRWIYNSVTEWLPQFPFWSRSTVTRIIEDLEADELLFVGNFNKIAMDRTKWYSINYEKLEKLYDVSNQDDKMHLVKMSKWNSSNCVNGFTQNELTNTRDYTETTQKKKNVELSLDVISEIIEYLNLKTNKNFKASSTNTKRLISGRLREGYTVEQLKQVVDIKVAQWLNNQEMNGYLRPSTLFNAKNFENYWNEVENKQTSNCSPAYVVPSVPILDFGE